MEGSPVATKQVKPRRYRSYERRRRSLTSRHGDYFLRPAAAAAGFFEAFFLLGLGLAAFAAEDFTAPEVLYALACSLRLRSNHASQRRLASALPHFSML